MKSYARSDKCTKKKTQYLGQGCWDVIYVPTGSSIYANVLRGLGVCRGIRPSFSTWFTQLFLRATFLVLLRPTNWFG